MNIYLTVHHDINGDNGLLIENYIDAVAEVLELDKYEGDISIELMKKCDGDAGGYCYGDHEDIEIEIATHVQGEALDFDVIKQNIAHEMIHAQQMASGRLIDHGLQVVNDCLVKVSRWDGEYHQNTKYEDQPWEIDAYAREAIVKQNAEGLIV